LKTIKTSPYPRLLATSQCMMTLKTWTKICNLQMELHVSICCKFMVISGYIDNLY
jgi:hypothetical protein